MTATLMIIGTIIALFGTFSALLTTKSKLDDYTSFDNPTHKINTKKAIIWIAAIIVGIGLLIAGAVMQQQEIQKTSTQQTINQEKN